MEEELLVQTFKVQGRDKLGRKVLRIVGKLFPAKIGEQAVKRGTWRGGYFQSWVVNPSVSSISTPTSGDRRTSPASRPSGLYTRLSPPLSGITSRPSISSTPAFAPDSSSPPSAGCSSVPSYMGIKVRYVSRVEYLWKRMRRGEMEVPAFVQEHDVELEDRPLIN